MTELTAIAGILAIALAIGGGCRPEPSPQPATPQATSAAIARPTQELTLKVGDGVTMRCVFIPAGTFMLGSSAADPDHFYWEGPQHKATLSKPFHMGAFEVTQEQYEQVTGKNPSHFKGKMNPVEMVLWGDATEFCRLLSGKSGKTVRLPTEAEWEYACRAGSQSLFHYGDDTDFSKVSDYAWHKRNSNSQTHPVGQKKSNRWGLYDMHGNVSEWCSDWYDGLYAGAETTDPGGPATGGQRIMRGGAWHSTPLYCRSASRARYDPYRRSYSIGFRVVVDLE